MAKMDCADDFDLSDATKSSRIRAFSELLATYWALRASLVTTTGEEAVATMSAKADEAERRVMFTPVASKWQIYCKLDILQRSLDDGGTWTDRRDTAYLGAIRADLLAQR